MLISNIEKFSDRKFYVVNRYLSNVMQKNKLPLFSYNGEKYYFVENQSSRKIIESLSVYDRLFSRWEIVEFDKNGK